MKLGGSFNLCPQYIYFRYWILTFLFEFIHLVLLIILEKSLKFTIYFLINISLNGIFFYYILHVCKISKILKINNYIIYKIF